MEAETFHSPLTRSPCCLQSYLDCQLKQGKIIFLKKAKQVFSDVNMSTVERIP